MHTTPTHKRQKASTQPLSAASEGELHERFRLVKYYLKTEELERAEGVLVICQAMLKRWEDGQKKGNDQKERDDQKCRIARYCIEIRAQLANIKFKRSKYKEAQRSFNTVLHGMGKEFDDRERNVVKKAIARLLENTPNKSISHGVIEIEIPIQRDLALVYAYQGDYRQALSHIKAAHGCLDRALNEIKHGEVNGPPHTKSFETMVPRISMSHDEIQEIDFPITPAKILETLHKKRDHLHLTESKIHYMLGDFSTALRKSGEALGNMEKRWKARDRMTLECASHHSILLALNSRIDEAYAIGVSAFVAIQKELGPGHAQTLKTKGHLTLLGLGDYASAEVKLRGVIKDVRKRRRTPLPDILHYQSQLALAKYHSGKLREAEELVLLVFREQMGIYTWPNERSPPRTSGETLLDCQDAIKDLLDTINKSPKSPTFHPRLLQTLRTMALIAQKDRGFEKLAFQILETVWERNKHFFGESSIFTLDSEYDLALAYRAASRNPNKLIALRESARHLQLVYQGRHSIFGSNHLGTASARREFNTGSTALSQLERCLGNIDRTTKTEKVAEEMTGRENGISQLDLPTKRELVEAEPRRILRIHELFAGEHHPETWRSLLWLLVVQVLSRDTEAADETLHRALQSVRHTSARRERFIESLDFEEQFAVALSVLGDKHQFKALQIVREITYTIEKLPARTCSPLQRSMKLLKANIDEHMGHLFIEVPNHRKEWKANIVLVRVGRPHGGST
ncbi:hypothetical protein O1611_g4465 [Lasiodiplodia mahajangana]|uniref:Uncharacterized protein n=1 Tax=Lasiodiplodia mahajangana TaxID=1108764 RepID=A0ACC2JNU0_9PEZI|nr:hypothetical protein O1611_g4465 [Lasiodiplodia mahajangana]